MAIYKDNVGTEIIIDLGVSLTDATVTLMNVQKPDGSTVEWIATVYEDTKLRYVTVEGDHSLAGVYKIHPYVRLNGFEGSRDMVVYEVEDLHK
jgi:hypothetical protein